MLLQSSSNNLALISWLADHAAIIGWPTLLVFAWKASGWVTDLRHKAVDAAAQINTMATEYFPQMRDSLKTQDGLMKSMDSSLKTIADDHSLFQAVTASKTRVRKPRPRSKKRISKK